MYIKRGVQGRLKSATDDIGTQFSPGNTNVVLKKLVSSVSNETFAAGVSKSTLLGDEVSSELMNSEVMNVTSEYWG